MFWFSHDKRSFRPGYLAPCFRTRNTIKKRACFGLRLIERGAYKELFQNLTKPYHWSQLSSAPCVLVTNECIDLKQVSDPFYCEISQF